MAKYSVYDESGTLISGWPNKGNAIAAGVALRNSGMVGHYVVKEKNSELVWSAWTAEED